MSVTREMIIKALKDSPARPLRIRDLMQRLNLPSDLRGELREEVRSMAAQGILIRIKGNRYALPGGAGMALGRFSGHPDGYGFVAPDGGEGDVFIPPGRVGGAMDGDRVMLVVSTPKRRGRRRMPTLRREGSIVSVVERARKRVVGRYRTVGSFGFVTPYERRLFRDIIVDRSSAAGAVSGQEVVAEITEYPDGRGDPRGRIVEVLGFPSEPGVDTEVIIRKYDLPRAFPPEVMREAEECAGLMTRQEMEARADLRRLNAVTIDGETAKDYDDAVSIQRLRGGGFRLGVHIADVSHFVREGTALDREARHRGTSIYFPDRVIPMLPPSLSDDLCSLKPNQERLTVSVLMDFDREGSLRSNKILDSVIRSKERLTYTQVAPILEGGKGDLESESPRIARDLKVMGELASLLRDRRLREGSIDFDLPEPEVLMTLEGEIESVCKAPRNRAHMLIEDFMLAANRVVAAHMSRTGAPFIYRVHDRPDPLAMEGFNQFIKSFGIALRRPADVHPGDLQKLLESVRGKSYERTVNTILLRSMMKALYSVVNVGHFGLGFDHYTHFTSPIRRYPDLMVHRLLQMMIGGKGGEIEGMASSLSEVARHSSAREQLANEAEREIMDIHRAQVMAQRIGEAFEGYVTGVTPFGFFVELEEPFVEGLVHVTSLRDDYYNYVESQYMLVGSRTGITFRIGDRVLIRVANVNVERRLIDFEFIKKIRP